MECSNCGKRLPDSAKYCLECGEEQNKLICDVCDESIPYESPECPNCGVDTEYITSDSSKSNDQNEGSDNNTLETQETSITDRDELDNNMTGKSNTSDSYSSVRQQGDTTPTSTRRSNTSGSHSYDSSSSTTKDSGTESYSETSSIKTIISLLGLPAVFLLHQYVIFPQLKPDPSVMSLLTGFESYGEAALISFVLSFVIVLFIASSLISAFESS